MTWTKVQQELTERIAACQGDEERSELLRRALRFKSSWVELAEGLAAVQANGAWRGWGHGGFEDYCRKELHLRADTAQKLVASYTFLRSKAPALLETRDHPPVVPPLESVSYWRKAEEEGAAQDPRQLDEIRRAVLDEGVPPATLRRRFDETFFPMAPQDQRERSRQQILAAARRLDSLVGQTDLVPGELVDDIGAVLDDLERALEASGGHRND